MTVVTTVHPVVRRLEEEVVNSLPGGAALSKSRFTRFKQITKSLASPLALLWDKASLSSRGKGKFTSSFVSLCLFLWHLDGEHTDLDLVFLKFQVGVLMQLAVADVDETTGHTLSQPSVAVQQLGRQKLFDGSIGRLIARHLARARKGAAWSLSFFASLLLIKRGWPELCRQKRWDSVASHQMYLLRPPPALPVDSKAQLLKAVDKIIRPGVLYSKLSPSRNASLQSSRKNGGAYGVVVRKSYRLPRRRVPLLALDPAPGMWSKPNARQIASSISSWKASTWLDVKSSVIKKKPPRVRFNTDQAGRQRTYVQRAVRVQVIPEPAKFRIITAGDAWLNTYLQPLQGHLLSCWAGSIFSTMKDGWERRVESWVAPPGWVWNSGDYEAATDQLNMNATLITEEAIRLKLDVEVETDLSGTWIRYSRKDLDPKRPRLLETVFQQNGQLMGHPLSFPLLCIINLAGLLTALERGVKKGVLAPAERKFILDHTIINGDDILFPCPAAFCREWERAAGDVGLKLSKGKSYASAHFAMVNNVMFHMTPRGGRQLGYLNQKLVYNFSLKAGEAEKSPFEIGHAFNKMFEAFPATQTFLSDAVKNRRDFPVMGYQPNFFISSQLGGLGVKPEFASRPVGFTRIQRQVAAACAEGVLNSFTISSGLPSSKTMGDMLKTLPSVRLSSGANADKYSDRFIHQGYIPILFSDEKEFGPDPFVLWNDPDTYQGWVGQFMSVLPPAEAKSRRIDLKRLKVKPMGVRKIKAFKAVWLFPRVPKFVSSFVPTYPRASKRSL